MKKEGLESKDIAEIGGREGNDFDDLTMLGGSDTFSSSSPSGVSASSAREEKAGSLKVLFEECLREEGALANGLGASGSRTTKLRAPGAESALDAGSKAALNTGSGARCSRPTVLLSPGADSALGTGPGGASGRLTTVFSAPGAESDELGFCWELSRAGD